MQSVVSKSVFFLSKIQKHHIQIFFLLISILVLVLGAGAPTGPGDGMH